MQSLAQMMRVLALPLVLLILGLSRAEAAVTRDGISARKIAYEMDIDNFIDENMDTIREVAWNLDPLQLDDINFPLMKEIYMFLHTGWAQNIAQLKRVGKCHLRYADRKLNVDLNLGWDDIAFDYRYLIKMLLVKRAGDLHGQMTKLDVHVALEIDFNNYHVTLKALDLVEKGKINISLEGHLLDWLANLAIKTVTRVFRTITLNTISDKMRGMIVHRIDEINFKLGSMIDGRRFTFVDLTRKAAATSHRDSRLIDNAIADRNH